MSFVCSLSSLDGNVKTGAGCVEVSRTGSGQMGDGTSSV